MLRDADFKSTLIRREEFRDLLTWDVNQIRQKRHSGTIEMTTTTNINSSGTYTSEESSCYNTNSNCIYKALLTQQQHLRLVKVQHTHLRMGFIDDKTLFDFSLSGLESVCPRHGCACVRL